MTEKRGPKEKPTGQTVKNVTVYVKELDIITLGGIVRVRMIVKDFISNELKKLNK
jgi:hypothetical protein